jgi:hypothetical protein
MIDAPATYNRAMSWASYKYQLSMQTTSTLRRHSIRAGSTSGLQEAMEVQRHQHQCGRVRNLKLVSPHLATHCASHQTKALLTQKGRTIIIGGPFTVPIASLGLKQIRDGLEDLEYMYLLQDATGSRDAAEAIVSSVVHATYNFEHGPAAFVRAREKLAAAVEVALGIKSFTL